MVAESCINDHQMLRSCPLSYFTRISCSAAPHTLSATQSVQEVLYVCRSDLTNSLGLLMQGLDHSPRCKRLVQERLWACKCAEL